MRDGLGAVDSAEFAGQLGNALDQIGERGGRDPRKRGLGLLVPGLDAEPLDVALDHESAQKLDQRQNTRRAGDHDMILDMHLFSPRRESSSGENSKVSTFG